jgi:multiple sugar transport system substrate-binding protein
MIHGGQFVQGAFPAEERDQVVVAPFPEVIPGVGPFDEVSYNSVHIPSGAKNKSAARDFLAFLYRPENLTAFLRPEGAISPRSDAPTSDTPLMRSVGEAMRPLKGSSQFYDRDTDPDMAQIGLNGFQEFMAAPDRRVAIQERLEAARKRIFKS